MSPERREEFVKIYVLEDNESNIAGATCMDPLMDSFPCNSYIIKRTRLQGLRGFLRSRQSGERLVATQIPMHAFGLLFLSSMVASRLRGF